MEKQLKYELMEYSSAQSEAIYLRKPLTVAELKRTYPNLKGVVFEFRRSAFEPLRYDHQAYLMEVLQAFDFQEVTIDSVGRLTHLPDTLWKPSLKKLDLARHHCTFPVQPPPGFKNNLDAISLHGSSYIDPSIFDTPSLKQVEVSNYAGDLRGLAKAVNVEKLFLMGCDLRALDFSRLARLERLELNRSSELEYLPDFSTLRNLADLCLSSLPQLRALPEGMNNLTKLYKIRFYHLGNPESPKVPFVLPVLPHLEMLDIANCNFDYSHSENIETPENTAKTGFSGILSKVFNREDVSKNDASAKMPALKSLRFMDAFAQSIPEFMFAPSLEQCWFLTVPELRELPAAFWQCTRLKQFSLSGNSMANFGMSWQVFPDLETFTVETSGACGQLPDFGKANTALNSISVKVAERAGLPDSWCECPGLHTLTIEAKPGELPAAWHHFPALKNLKIRWIDGAPIFIRKEIALLPNLQALRIECQNPGRDMKLVQTLNTTLTKFSAEPRTRLVFGHLLLENPEKAAPYSDAFKTDFLQAVNIGSSPLKQVIWDNLYLLNPDRTAFSALRQFEQKSLFIAGGTRVKKADYKEKLEGMGVKIVAKLSSDVDFILVGNAFPDLPEGFWAKPHWFCSEMELDTVLKEYQPGFMQTLPENDLEALRRLIWSNDPANERVVLEMLKKGGIPDAVIPDLVVVAKTSADQAVRNDFRKLLKAKAPEDLRAVLSDTRDLDKIIERFRHGYVKRPVGVSQVVVAHYYRTKNKELLPEFFRHRESLDNPYRAAIFQEWYPALLKRPHYISIQEFLLSQSELEHLLNAPAVQGVLKRLLVRCAGDALPAALFRHTTLEELKITTDSAHLPEAVGELKRLKNLEVNGKNLRSLPDSLLQVKSLKSLRFCSSLNREDWEISQALQESRSGNHWMQQLRFDYLD